MSLLKSKKGFFTNLKEFFVGKTISDDMYEDLEELLISSDMGIRTSMSIIEELEKNVKRKKLKTSEQLYLELEEILISKLNEANIEKDLKIEKDKLNILFIVGINGVGKTTSIAKIANMFKEKGKNIVVGAADTFRAAAIEQLDEWCNKINIKMIKHSKGTDPAAVVFDTLNYANKEKVDIAIIDTAGRLHNKKNLMEELSKIKKIIDSKSSDANVKTLLVIDSTTGQNGLEQAKIFNEIADISGIILTKYDGTAKGGIIFPIILELKKPIMFLGVGEGLYDIKVFDAKEFVKEIFDK